MSDTPTPSGQPNESLSAAVARMKERNPNLFWPPGQSGQPNDPSSAAAERLKARNPDAVPVPAAGNTPAEEYKIIGEWLAHDTGEHNCAGGFADVGYAHVRDCGWEPIGRIADLIAPPVLPADLLAAVERLLESIDGHPFKPRVRRAIAAVRRLLAEGTKP